HMVYTSPGCLEKLVGDLRIFYAAGVGEVGAAPVATGPATTAPVDLSDLDERPDLPPLDLV
ncbi:MAG: hypothetical protein L0L69_05635, partial [Propionibacterium sp.]|nr:hypothetical protein [Propionibacterium sp.]